MKAAAAAPARKKVTADPFKDTKGVKIIVDGKDSITITREDLVDGKAPLPDVVVAQVKEITGDYRDKIEKYAARKPVKPKSSAEKKKDPKIVRVLVDGKDITTVTRKDFTAGKAPSPEVVAEQTKEILRSYINNLKAETEKKKAPQPQKPRQPRSQSPSLPSVSLPSVSLPSVSLPGVSLPGSLPALPAELDGVPVLPAAAATAVAVLGAPVALRSIGESTKKAREEREARERAAAKEARKVPLNADFFIGILPAAAVASLVAIGVATFFLGVLAA